MRDCIVCKTAKNSKQYCHLDDQDYLRCNDCGLIYVDKILNTEKLYKAYSGDFFKSFRRKLFSPFRKFHQYRNFTTGMMRARQIIDFTAEQITTSPKGVEYLDIGCNRGYLLGVAQEWGWNPYGVELVPELMAPFLNTFPQFKSQVFSERFEDTRKKYLREDMFDVITGIDVVEHFEEVVDDIAGIYAVLKPGGVVIFQTPDADCQQAYDRKCDWGALKPLEHLHLFTVNGLEKLALSVGFSDCHVNKEFEEADGNFVVVLRK